MTNDKSGWKQLQRRLEDLDIEVVVLEATGKFHRGVHRSLADDGFAVSVLNPYRSRKFSDALGELAKTDEIDARVLALAGEALKPDVTPPQPKSLEKLQELLQLCNAFKADRTSCRNRLAGLTDAVAKKQQRYLLESLERRITALETELMMRIKADPALLHRFEILTSVPGIGPVTATTMIVNLAELGSLSSKEIAALVGVAPMNRDSGTMRGQRRIRGGRASVRTPMYMAALAAARSVKSGLKPFYQRLIGNGKPVKLALTAVIRKLVILANTLIKEDRLWQPIAP